MHSNPILRSRRLAIIVAATFVVITVVSIGYHSGPLLDGTRLYRRQSSTFTISLPWKAESPPAVESSPISSALTPNSFLKGISNLAGALQEGGITIENNVAASEIGSLSMVFGDSDGLLQSSVATLNGQATQVVGELLSAGGSLAMQAISTATSPSNVGAINPAVTTDGFPRLALNRTCDCDVRTSLPSTLIGNVTKCTGGHKHAMHTTSSPDVQWISITSCPPPTTMTYTETWHSTDYATLYSFLSVLTVTKTADVPPSPTYLNCGAFLESTDGRACESGPVLDWDESDCSSTFGDGSSAPVIGASFDEAASGGSHRFQECSHSTLHYPASTSIQNHQCKNRIPTPDCQCGCHDHSLQPQTLSTVDGDTGQLSSSVASIFSPTSGTISNEAPPLTTTVSYTNIETPSTRDDDVTRDLPAGSVNSIELPFSDGITAAPTPVSTQLTGITKIASLTSPPISSSSINVRPSAMNSFVANLLSTPTRESLLDAVLSTTGAAPLITPPPPPIIAEYGSKVLQGASSGVSGALASIGGLSGNILSAVLSEVNSVLEVALSTAVPLQNQISPGLVSILPMPASNLLVEIDPISMPTIPNIIGNPPELAVPILPTLSAEVADIVNTTPPTVVGAINEGLINTGSEKST